VWHRLSSHVVAWAGDDHRWWPAVVLAALWYLVTLFAARLLLRELVGDHPAGDIALVLIAVSPVFLRDAQWWTVAAHQLPTLCFGLLTVWAARRRRFALALVFYALALLAFIKALLIPLALLAVLGLPRRRDWPLWAGVATLTAAYLVVISGERYYRYIEGGRGAGAGDWLEFLRVGILEGTLPPVVGLASAPDLSALRLVAVVVSAVAVVALVVVTARRSSRAALAWAGGFLVALGALVMSGGARLDRGVDAVALDPRYPAEGIVALQIALAVAVAAAWPRLRLRAAPVIAGAALVAAFVVASASRLDQEWVGPEHEAWFDRLEQSRDRLEARGIEPAVLDGNTPGFLVAPEITGSNLLSKVIPLRERDLRVGDADGTPVVSAPDGALRPVELRTLVGRSVPQCLALERPLTLPVRAPAAAELRILELRFAPLERQFEGTITADSGSTEPNRAGPVTLPPVVTTHPRIPAGRTSHRFIAGAGRLERITFAGDPGRPICLSRVAVLSAPLGAAR
jgi:hypothetical protein